MNKRKIAYLTIDDAPTKDALWKAEFLLSKNIPAIWYCCGKELEKNSDIALELLGTGFVIGNHSYSHRHFSELSTEEAFEEISKTDKIIEGLYKKASRKAVKTFRFPYGDKGGGEDVFENANNPVVMNIQKTLKEFGYHQPEFKGICYKKYLEAGLLDNVDVYWTYDCKEWTTFHQGATFEALERRMDEDDPEDWKGLNSNYSNEIILIHDHIETSGIFKELIEKLISKNITFELPEF